MARPLRRTSPHLAEIIASSSFRVLSPPDNRSKQRLSEMRIRQEIGPSAEADMKISAFLPFSSSSREIINMSHPVSLRMLKDMLHATYKQNSFVESMHPGSHCHRHI